ncbi:ABC transporter permease [Candidatus Sumerlaeota bacterium]|nr:ABC transporter permease [Candidatus Sumerlaeota bacterium]
MPPPTDASLKTTPTLVIEPPRGWIAVNFRELWQYRELFGFLVWRDIKVKYKQTLLGAIWAILVPLVQALIFTIIFSNVAGLSSDGLPPTLFFYIAMLIWTYFATSLTMSANSLVGSSNLLTKIYFPRLIVPAGPCLAGLVDFAIGLIILVVMLIHYRFVPPATALLFPIFLALALITALGTGLFLSALNVKYRDIRFAVPFLIQMWMYVTVIISFTTIAQWLEGHGIWPYLWGLNPLVAVVEGFRWCLVYPHTDPAIGPPWMLLAVGTPVALVILFSGLFYFRRMEKQFADII